MTGRPRIITDNRSFSQQYKNLASGDCICGRLRLRPGEEHLLLDLSARGIVGIPSFLSQLCSRSKVFQTRLFSSHMLPGTQVIYTIHDLLEAITEYGRENRGDVIVKLEGKNAGLGILKFASIEDVYSQSVLDQLPYPYVIQPFVPELRDLRVIIIDDYTEAYERSNPHSFRNNLHCGGGAAPVDLTDQQQGLCTAVMERGGFPYAHLDLIVAGDGGSYMNEINLRGGLRGARIHADDYQLRIEQAEEKRCRMLLEKSFQGGGKIIKT